MTTGECISLRDVLGAAIDGNVVEARNEKKRDLLVVQFHGKPSWEHANVIAAFKMNAQDVLHRSLTIAGGGLGSVVIKFDVGDLDVTERKALKLRIEHLIKSEFVLERYGIKAIDFKPAGEKQEAELMRP